MDSLANRSTDGAPLDAESGLRVLIVRHAESTNNQLQDFLATSTELAAAGPAAPEQHWLARREDDPPLSEKGRTEAQLLSDFYRPILASMVRDGGEIRILPSAFLRTCQVRAAERRPRGKG